MYKFAVRDIVCDIIKEDEGLRFNVEVVVVASVSVAEVIVCL